ncbi:hypothetical protein JOF53_007418 [Crossiella equi]|uniref:Uncharacterized protein n=1 Tax=Crossiella equi TaxID=130796 RepID=A0ABS5APQ0_9PSEU|nr:hypothetical protein [Crossiella equi]MBP2478546.1 hypothetical protein [Crossiella equi]
MRALGRRTGGVVAAVLAAGLAMAVLPGTASATHEGSPGGGQLLGECDRNRTDLCEFRPSGNMTLFWGQRQLAGSSTNCTNFNQTRVVRYEASSGTRNTFGVELSATVKVKQVFETSVKTSYQREWSMQETTADELRQDVGKKSRVMIYATKQQAQVNGTWELHFGKRYYGHYYWYVSGQATGQIKGQPWDLRAEQVKANC